MDVEYYVEIVIEEGNVTMDADEKWFDTFREAFAFMVAFNNDQKRLRDHKVAYSPERVEY